MSTVAILVKNSSDSTIELLIEPLVHLYKIEPGSSYSVVLEDQPSDEAVEVEYLTTGITVYSGGFATVTSGGEVVPPQFLD